MPQLLALEFDPVLFVKRELVVTIFIVVTAGTGFTRGAVVSEEV